MPALSRACRSRVARDASQAATARRIGNVDSRLDAARRCLQRVAGVPADADDASPRARKCCASAQADAAVCAGDQDGVHGVPPEMAWRHAPRHVGFKAKIALHRNGAAKDRSARESHRLASVFGNLRAPSATGLTVAMGDHGTCDRVSEAPARRCSGWSTSFRAPHACSLRAPSRLPAGWCRRNRRTRASAGCCRNWAGASSPRPRQSRHRRRHALRSRQPRRGARRRRPARAGAGRYRRQGHRRARACRARASGDALRLRVRAGCRDTARRRPAGGQPRLPFFHVAAGMDRFRHHRCGARRLAAGGDVRPRFQPRDSNSAAIDGFYRARCAPNAVSAARSRSTRRRRNCTARPASMPRSPATRS